MWLKLGYIEVCEQKSDKMKTMSKEIRPFLGIMPQYVSKFKMRSPFDLAVALLGIYPVDIQ